MNWRAEGQAIGVLIGQVQPGDVVGAGTCRIQKPGDLILGMAVAQGRVEAVVKGVPQLQVVGVLWAQKWVALLVGQFIQTVLEGVQILVRRAIDAAAVV